MPRRLLSLLLASTLLALASGCASKAPEDSSIPWSRPASWEGGMPGMGGLGNPR
ncbi:MAG: hypothetical protein MUE42_01415 [Opitutaceae bacterium]|jgi:hypothetical protein|nr:hypothetical protein [Opitutaceae bacterium]